MMVVPIFFLILLLRVQFAVPASNQRCFGRFGELSQDQHSTLNFQSNLKNLLGIFASQASKIGFYNSTFGEAPDQVYGLYLCRGDINSQVCSDCVTYIKDAMFTIPMNRRHSWWRNSTQAMIWYEHCMISYSHKSFFGEMEEPVGGTAVWDSRHNGTLNWIRFAEVLGDTMSHSAVLAAKNGSRNRFATKVVKLARSESLYAMGQCTWDLNPGDCIKCLNKANELVFSVSGGQASSGRALYPSCIVRYETFPFFNSTSSLTNLITSSLSVMQDHTQNTMK